MANKSRETANLVSSTGISTFRTEVDFVNGPVQIGSATSTGTVDQKLQVTGGAYVSGSVGIGTTNPLSLLTVSSNQQNFEFTPGSSAYNGGLLEYINRTTSTTRPDFNYFLGGGSNGAHKFYTNASEKFRISSSGNVGVGTTTPEETVHLGGASNKQIRIDSFHTIPTFFGAWNNGASIAVNRRISDGAIVNSTRSAAFITLSGEPAGSYITFNTASAANTQPVGRLIINELGYAGFGTDQTSTVLSRFQVITQESVPADNGNIFTISSAGGNLVEKLNMGVTTGYAWIQATKPGTSVRPLILNPSGSWIGIGTTTRGGASYDASLDVLAQSGEAIAIRVRGNGVANNNAQIRFWGNSSAADLWAIGNAIPDGSATRNFDIFDLVVERNRVRINSLGYIGIATDVEAKSQVSIAHTTQLGTTLVLNAGNNTSKGEYPLLATMDAKSVSESDNGHYLYDNNTAGDLQLYRKNGVDPNLYPVLAIDRSQTQVAIGTDGFYPAAIPIYVRGNASTGDSYGAFFGSNNVSNYGLNGGIGIGANPTTGDGFIANLGPNNGIAFYTESTGGITRVAARLSPTGIHTVGNQPAFSAYRSGDQTGMNFTSGNNSVAIFNATYINIGGHYSTTTGLFTAPVAGRYAFSAGGYTSDGIEEAWWIVNGGRNITPMSSPSSVTPKAMDIFYLASGDTVGVHFYDSAGQTNGSMYANQYHTYFKGYLVC